MHFNDTVLKPSDQITSNLNWVMIWDQILKKYFFEIFDPPGGPSRGVGVKIFKMTENYIEIRFRRF